MESTRSENAERGGSFQRSGRIWATLALQVSPEGALGCSGVCACSEEIVILFYFMAILLHKASVTRKHRQCFARANCHSAQWRELVLHVSTDSARGLRRRVKVTRLGYPQAHTMRKGLCSHAIASHSRSCLCPHVIASDTLPSPPARVIPESTRPCHWPPGSCLCPRAVSDPHLL